MPRAGLPQWQKSKHTTTYGTSTAKTTQYKNLKMHINMDALNKIKGDLVNLAMSHIRYGIVDDVRYPMVDPNRRGGVYVAEIWRRLEFGHVYPTTQGKPIVIPPRPIFAIHQLEDGRVNFEKFAKEVTADIFAGRYAGQASWTKFGLLMQNSLKKKVMTYKSFKPLSHVKKPRTVLDFYMDTGYLLSQISYRYMPIPLPHDNK